MRTLMLASSLFVSTMAMAEDWVVIDQKDGVTTSQKTVEGSSMLAFRGEAEVAVHASRLLGLLVDTSKGASWVDLLIESAPLQTGATESVIYNRYDLSWPISDRDYVMRRVVQVDAASRSVTTTYNSVEHAQKPPADCCVRALAHRTYWRFTALPGGRTRVEVEVHTDPKGMLPAWLVNMIQRDWPSNSIQGLARRAAQADVTPFAEISAW
jgi:hypothetical protein